MENKKGISKKVLWSVLIISFLIVLIVLLAFGIFFKNQGNVNTKESNPGIITMNYADSNVFELSNLTPVTDAAGKKNNESGQYFDFSVNTKVEDADEIDYEIAVSVNKSDTNIDVNKLKVYLEKEESGSYSRVFGPSIFKAITSKSKYGSPTGSMILYKNNVKNNTTDNYRLRVWLDSTSSDLSGNAVSLTIDVYGVSK